MALHFHPEFANLLAVGCYDGSVMVFDVRKTTDNPICQASAKTKKHADPVWQVCWQVGVVCTRLPTPKKQYVLLQHMQGRKGGVLPAFLACIRLYSTDHILNMQRLPCSALRATARRQLLAHCAAASSATHSSIHCMQHMVCACLPVCCCLPVA
jgi:hypothetical protein